MHGMITVLYYHCSLDNAAFLGHIFYHNFPNYQGFDDNTSQLITKYRDGNLPEMRILQRLNRLTPLVIFSNKKHYLYYKVCMIYIYTAQCLFGCSMITTKCMY